MSTTIEQWERFPGVFADRCVECRRWAEQGQAIVHSSSCDSRPQRAVFAAPTCRSEARAQLAVKRERSDAETARLAREGRLGEDEAYDAYKAGVITMSDAMNQDF